MRRFLLPLTLTLAMTIHALAEPESKLGLRQAMREALVHNFNLLISKTTIEEKEAGVTKSLGDFDFNLSLTGTRDHSETPSTSTQEGVASEVVSDTTTVKPILSKKTTWGTEFTLPYSYSISESNSSYNRIPVGHSTSLGLTITQPLFRGLTPSYYKRNVTKAEIDLESARESHGEKIDDTALKAAELFLDAVRDRETIRVREVALQSTQATEEFVHAKQKLGKASLVDALEAESARAKAEEALLSAKSTAANKLDELAQHVYGEIRSGLALESSIDEYLREPEKLSLAQLLTEARQNRKELKSGALALKKAQLELHFSKVDLRPDLDLEGSVTNKGLASSYSESQSQINRGESPSWSVSLKLDQPLLRYAARGAKQSKSLQLEQQKIKQAQLELDITLELRKALRQVDTNWERLKAFELAARAQDQRLEAQNRLFQAGRLSVTELNRVRQDHVSAQIEVIKARLSYVKSRLQLAAARGLILRTNS